MPTVYQRSERDEEKAEKVMLQKSWNGGTSFTKKSPRRKIKRLANADNLMPKLGRYVMPLAGYEVILEPSKYFADKFLYQKITMDFMGTRTIESELLSVREATRKLLNINIGRHTRYDHTDIYTEYKDSKTYITVLPKEEKLAEEAENRKKEAEEALKRERFAEPFYNWLSN